MNYTTKSFLHCPPQLAKNTFSFAEIALYPLVHWWVSGRLSFSVGQPLDERECFDSQVQSFISLALEAQSTLQHLKGPSTQTSLFLEKRLLDPFAYNAQLILHFYHSLSLCPNYIQTVSGFSRAQQPTGVSSTLLLIYPERGSKQCSAPEALVQNMLQVKLHLKTLQTFWYLTLIPLQQSIISSSVTI